MASDTCPIEIQNSNNKFCPSSFVQSNLGVMIYLDTISLNAGSYIINIKYIQNPDTYGYSINYINSLKIENYRLDSSKLGAISKVFWLIKMKILETLDLLPVILNIVVRKLL